MKSGRRHVVVLPYWCDAEVDNFLQVLGKWDRLCRTRHEYSFLVARRFDVPGAGRLEEACSAIAPTAILRCDGYDWKGWPGGANGMFRHVMEHVARTEERDGGFVFWFEHDVVPIYADWLDWLDHQWGPDLLVMGQYMAPPWINLHQLNMPPNINGTACYGKSLAESAGFGEISPDVPFDFTLSSSLPRRGGRCLALPLLFDNWFFI